MGIPSVRALRENCQRRSGSRRVQGEKLKRQPRSRGLQLSSWRAGGRQQRQREREKEEDSSWPEDAWDLAWFGMIGLAQKEGKGVEGKGKGRHTRGTLVAEERLLRDPAKGRRSVGAGRRRWQGREEVGGATGEGWTGARERAKAELSWCVL